MVRVQSRVSSPLATSTVPLGFSRGAERTPRAGAWVTGFVIGAEGEVVFGAAQRPAPDLIVRAIDGAEYGCALLAYDRDLSLAVGRITRTSQGNPRLAPLKVASSPGLLERRWVVVMKHDSQGRAEPFAGTVEANRDAPEKTRATIPLAWVAAPASAGSPVLSTRGELVGVAIEEGKRSARVAAIESLGPFLQAAVLGVRR